MFTHVYYCLRRITGCCYSLKTSHGKKKTLYRVYKTPNRGRNLLGNTIRLLTAAVCLWQMRQGLDIADCSYILHLPQRLLRLGPRLSTQEDGGGPGFQTWDQDLHPHQQSWTFKHYAQAAARRVNGKHKKGRTINLTCWCAETETKRRRCFHIWKKLVVSVASERENILSASESLRTI